MSFNFHQLIDGLKCHKKEDFRDDDWSVGLSKVISYSLNTYDPSEIDFDSFTQEHIEAALAELDGVMVDDAEGWIESEELSDWDVVFEVEHFIGRILAHKGKVYESDHDFF
ncbi:hypothetical protein [Bacillus swezeyi]|uniref:Uncharacterized protein n=1 Tax=Bacillus swezeyi TaxID=1925020 RepID=A0A5M8RHX7_9BACI|nr:hypothetical protein [Bacillus swezeyi]KAA6447000.1 hypothetical protein DX927_23445 [Bacillus swezeyi]KAA6471568.1 hypothetical protein DX928_23685 [Bacillus swezeyi]